jgi:hypothetical protein
LARELREGQTGISVLGSPGIDLDGANTFLGWLEIGAIEKVMSQSPRENCSVQRIKTER